MTGWRVTPVTTANLATIGAKLWICISVIEKVPKTPQNAIKSPISQKLCKISANFFDSAEYMSNDPTIPKIIKNNPVVSEIKSGQTNTHTHTHTHTLTDTQRTK